METNQVAGVIREWLHTAQGREKALTVNKLTWLDLQVEMTERGSGLEIAVIADETPVRFLALRWSLPLPEEALFLGDAWERSYGELQWRSLAPAQLMPWYFLMLTSKE